MSANLHISPWLIPVDLEGGGGGGGDGSGWLYGTDVPTGGVGDDGNVFFYFGPFGVFLIGPKAGGEWPLESAIQLAKYSDIPTGAVTSVSGGDGINIGGTPTAPVISSTLFSRRPIRSIVTLSDEAPVADVAIPNHSGFFIRYEKQPGERTVSAQLRRNSGSFWININATIYRETGTEFKQRRSWTVGNGFPDWIDSYNAASTEAGQATYTRAIFESANSDGTTDITITPGGTMVGQVTVTTTFTTAFAD